MLITRAVSLMKWWAPKCSSVYQIFDDIVPVYFTSGAFFAQLAHSFRISRFAKAVCASYESIR